MTRPLCVLSLCLSAAFGACGGRGGSAPAGVELGPGGGVVAIAAGALAGASLTVPAGALDGRVVVSIRPGTVPGLPLIYTVIGPAVRFEPLDATFALPAEATVPFDLERVVISAGPDLRVLIVDEAAGTILESLAPRGLDEVRGRMSILLSTGATCIAVEKIGNETISFPEYLPLVPDSAFEFDDGTTLSIEDGGGVPNLGGVETLALSFDDGSRRHGFYWSRNGIGQTLWHGRYSTAPTFQEVAITPGRVFPESFVSGRETLSLFDYAWYPAIRPSNPAHYGTADLAVVIEPVDGPLSVPLGEFTDVVEADVSLLTAQGVSFERFRFWLARDVGVIRYTIAGQTAALVAGTIRGRRVVPR